MRVEGLLGRVGSEAGAGAVGLRGVGGAGGVHVVLCEGERQGRGRSRRGHLRTGKLFTLL